MSEKVEIVSSLVFENRRKVLRQIKCLLHPLINKIEDTAIKTYVNSE